MGFSKEINIPIITALIIGLLGATAPCQLTTNLGAIGYLANKGTDRKKLFSNAIWYLSGKVLIFFLYGLITIVFKISFQQKSIVLFSLARKIAGPLIVVVGLNIVGFLRFKISIGEKLMDRFYGNSKKLKILNPSFTMGIFFSFAFCPTLFWLFFGIIIPLSLKASMGLLFPVVFAIGTVIPMLLILTVMSLAKDNSGNLVKAFRKSEKIIRKVGGVLLIAFGLIDTIVYFFV